MKYLIAFTILLISTIGFSQTKYELTYNTMKSCDSTGHVDSLSHQFKIVVNSNSNGDLKLINEAGDESIFAATSSASTGIKDGYKYSGFNALDDAGRKINIKIFESDHIGTCLHYDLFNGDIFFYNKYDRDTLFHDNGKILQVTDYDQLIETNYFENGKIQSTGSIAYYRLTYYENPKLEDEHYKLFMVKNSDWEYFYESGEIEERGLYDVGYRDEEWVAYYKNGRKKSIKNYGGRIIDGDQIGEEKQYNSDGTLKEINNYNGLGRLSEWEIYENNKLVKKGKVNREGDRITTWEKPEIFHVNFKNSCTQTINVLVHCVNLDGEWETHAWYVLDPGKEAFVQRTKNSSVFFHAHSKDKKLIWGGTDTYKMFGEEEFGLKKWIFNNLDKQKQTKNFVCN